MSKQVMIEKIYDIIADKTLNFGCKILRTSNDWSQKIYYALEPTPFGKLHISSIPFWGMTIEVDPDWISKSSWDEYRIIWHPVMIGDVLDWIEKKDFPQPLMSTYLQQVLCYWWDKRLPIEQQRWDDNLILFIYNLINEL